MGTGGGRCAVRGEERIMETSAFGDFVLSPDPRLIKYADLKIFISTHYGKMIEVTVQNIQARQGS